MISTVRSRRGAVLPLVCVLLVVLLGFAALAIDIGRLHVVAVEVQTAADAGALAGAAAAGSATSANRATAATAAAVALATANRAANGPAQTTASDVRPRFVDGATNAISDATWSDANAVEVTSRATPTYALAGVLKLTAPTVARRATATISSKLDGMACLRPMMLPYVGTYNRLFGTSLTTAPDMTTAQMATVSAMGPRSRSAIYLPPGEVSQSGRNDNGNWAPLDYTGGSGTLSSYTDWAQGTNCASAKATLKNTPAALHRGGAPSDYVNATTSALNAVCNFTPNSTDANCYDSPTATVPGLMVRVSFGDQSSTTAGSPVTIRSLTTVRIMCYFRTWWDKCQGASMPEGYWNPPYNANNYPPGTLVVLLNSPFPGSLPTTSDLIFGTGNSMSPTVTGMTGSGVMLAR